MADNPHLRHGLNVCQGKVTFEAEARALGYDHIAAESLLY